MPGTGLNTLWALSPQRPLARRVSVAASFAGRLLGLMGRQRLDPDEGIFLPGTNSIHMLFMHFPIDCLFVGPPQQDGSRRVVAIRRRLPPWRGVVWYVRGAKGVVELAAGTLEGANLSVGDLVRLEENGPGVTSPPTIGR